MVAKLSYSKIFCLDKLCSLITTYIFVITTTYENVLTIQRFSIYSKYLANDLIFLPDNVCRHCPVVISQTLTVESALPDTKMFSLSSMPDVKLWWPIRVCLQLPVSTSQTRMDVSKDPLTTWTPSNCIKWKSLSHRYLLKNIFLLSKKKTTHLQWIHTICVTLECV